MCATCIHGAQRSFRPRTASGTPDEAPSTHDDPPSMVPDRISPDAHTVRRLMHLEMVPLTHRCAC